MATNTKVFWHEEEKVALGQRIDLLVNVTKGYTLISALESAQKNVLPEGRRRKIKFWAQVQKQLAQHVAQAKKERETAELLEKTKLPVVAPPLTSDELLSQLSATVFLKALADPRVQTALQAVFLPLLGSTSSSPAETAPAEQSTDSSRKPKILIAGLLPAQAETVKKSYEKVFDLRFWGSNESKEHLRNMLKHSHAAVGIVSFISHSADAVLKDLSANYVRHPGGLKTLKTTLDNLRVVLQQEPAAMH